MPEGDHAVYLNYQTGKINSFVRDGSPTTTEFNFSLCLPRPQSRRVREATTPSVTYTPGAIVGGYDK